MLSHLETLSLMEALMVALSGFVLIFAVLGCLCILIQVNAKVIGNIEAAQKAKMPAPAPAAPAPSAAPVAAAEDEEELVAVMMAAIAEATQCDPSSFQITSVSEKR